MKQLRLAQSQLFYTALLQIYCVYFIVNRHYETGKLSCFHQAEFSGEHFVALEHYEVVCFSLGVISLSLNIKGWTKGVYVCVCVLFLIIIVKGKSNEENITEVEYNRDDLYNLSSIEWFFSQAINSKTKEINKEIISYNRWYTSRSEWLVKDSAEHLFHSININILGVCWYSKSICGCYQHVHELRMSAFHSKWICRLILFENMSQLILVRTNFFLIFFKLSDETSR